MSSRVTNALLGLTQLGHAAWFFGNLYEAVAKVPDRMATGERGTSPLGPGSPVRYYAAAGPVAVAPLVAAAVLDRDLRPYLVPAAACSLAAAAATGYLVKTVNLKLFFGTEPVGADERATLLRTWYRVNAVRLGLAGAALAAAGIARARLPR